MRGSEDGSRHRNCLLNSEIRCDNKDVKRDEQASEKQKR